MSFTTNQVEELRSYAKGRKGELAKLISDAADTIELLSMKLHAANMERSSAHYHGGWIPVDERMPEMYEEGEYEDGDTCLTSFESDSVLATTKNGYVVFGQFARWSDSSPYFATGVWEIEKDTDEVIAWMPIPEEYKGDK